MIPHLTYLKVAIDDQEINLVPRSQATRLLD